MVKVRVSQEKRKKYLTEMIGDDFWEWKGKKILISAPTGMGKTTFVIDVLVAHLRRRGKKLLILCNRRLLRMQYWHSIIAKFVSYAEIEECIKIMTYQELTEMVKKGANLKNVFSPYEMIVSDECHFFYSDSDFNGYGTYVLLQEMIEAGMFKTLIFMSATMEEVRPLIEQTIQNCSWRLTMTERNTIISKENEEILSYDFTQYADFSRFECTYVPDWDSLCEILAGSPRKTVIFLNNKEKGAAIMERLVGTGKIEKSNIEMLNADNIDIDSEVVQSLSISNKLNAKILITTAVLDNGVSIHDSEVGNVVIMTESRIEFLQMLGRIRAEDMVQCNLYFVQRDKSEFLKRMLLYRKEVEGFKNLSITKLRKNRNFYIQEMISGGEKADFYQKALVWMKFESQFFELPENEAYKLHLESDLYVNAFAKRKIGDMYLAESRFYELAVSDPLQVVYEQMRWIGKGQEELQVVESEYRQKRERAFIEKLLSVQRFTLDELKVLKEEIVKDFHKDFFTDILVKNSTISNEKLSKICEKYNLEFFAEDNPENRKQMYTIRRKKEEDKTNESE